MIEAVVLDLDGTTLDEHHQIPPLNQEVIRTLRAQGVKVYIATGRTYLSMKPYYDLLQLDTPAICYNGAKVVYANGTVREEGISHEQTAFLIDLAATHKLHLNVYQDEKWYTNTSQSTWAKEYAHISGLSPVQVKWEDLSTYASTKALYLGERTRLLDLVPLITHKWKDTLHLTSSKPHFLEVLKADVHKGNAIKRIMEEDEIPLENVIAFGDGLNDVEMLQTAGVGVAMKNGFEELKAIASDIALPNSQAGVGEYLKRFL